MDMCRVLESPRSVMVNDMYVAGFQAALGFTHNCKLCYPAMQQFSACERRLWQASRTV